MEIKGINGGKLYESYGIDSEGAFAIVRPDGYVGAVLRLHDTDALEKYFSGFMLKTL